MLGSVNQIYTVVCLLTNFQGPLIVKVQLTQFSSFRHISMHITPGEFFFGRTEIVAYFRPNTTNFAAGLHALLEFAATFWLVATRNIQTNI